MKKLLVILLLLPGITQAQEEQATKPYSPKNEIGLSAGAVPDILIYNGLISSAAALRLGYFKSINRLQVGLAIEIEEDLLNRSFAPVATLNYKLPTRKSYFYTGGALGYYQARNLLKFGTTEGRAQGFTMGVHAGYVLNLGKHFALTAEAAIRSTQVWFKDYHYIPPYTISHGPDEAQYIEYTDNRFFMTVPVTAGIRYRF